MFQDNCLAGHAAFISGGSSGINLAIAEALSRLGAGVCIIGRDLDKAQRAARHIRAASGCQVLALSADVRDGDAVAAAMAQARAELGELSIVVAGAAGNFFAPAVGISSRGFRTVVDIDLVGTFHVFRAGFDHCRKPGASFIAITAPQAVRPMAMQAHVCAAKAGVNALVRALALEWGPAGIRVNGIAPGLIGDTEGLRRLQDSQPREAARMREGLALRRFGGVADIASAAVYLAGPLGAYISGAILDVDGGFQLGDAAGDFLTATR